VPFVKSTLEHAWFGISESISGCRGCRGSVEKKILRKVPAGLLH
jgi:hypothetical protein